MYYCVVLDKQAQSKANAPSAKDWHGSTISGHDAQGYGVSKLTAKNTEDNPIYGLGQGAIDAPPNCALVTNICQKAYNKFAKGCTIIDPIRAISLKSNGKVFVDNNKLVHNGNAMDTLAKTLISIVIHDVSLWDCFI
eukprot:14582062-Ditylum_brightwellii.AAC.1